MKRINFFALFAACALFLLTACGGDNGAAHGNEHDGHNAQTHHEDHNHGEPVVEHSEMGITHAIWDDLMTTYVADGRVDYPGIQADARFEEYLGLLSDNHPDETWGEAATMAYWINAYNAFTIKLILDHYPIESIMKINDGKAWDLEFINIADKTYSLNGIEHGILRTDFAEPRIHFAVVCASFSCPPLRSEAFDAERLDAQLDEQARNFVADTRRNKIGENPPQISSLFDWYKDDFTKSGTVLEFINKYAATPMPADAKPVFMDYDWSLNE